MNPLLLEQLPQSHLVLRLVGEVQLRVEADGPLVQQGHVVRALLGREALHQVLIHLRGAAQHVEVLGHRGQYLGTLHLHRHLLARLAQGGAVHLGQGRRGDGLVGDGAEDLVHWAPELLLEHRHRLRRVEGLHVVLQDGELVERRLREHVRPHGHHLPELDVGGSQPLHVESCVAGKGRGVALKGAHAALDEQARHTCDVWHGDREELRPPLLQGGALRAPVCLDELCIIHFRQAIVVNHVGALVQRDKCLVRVWRGHGGRGRRLCRLNGSLRGRVDRPLKCIHHDDATTRDMCARVRHVHARLRGRARKHRASRERAH
mmetsp:Transcript_10369/g.30776  ORF Transcript_10369/g.30776 Transcript_10369/m.30776 type:complete len:319 (+) Transcript_10369:1806-2762(+)